MQRHDHGRAARAADLVATLSKQLPLTHPARTTLRELEQLFAPRAAVDDRVRALLERVPGSSLAKKGERIGVSKGTLWAIWHGKYRPNADVMARIEAAAGENADG